MSSTDFEERNWDKFINIYDANVSLSKILVTILKKLVSPSWFGLLGFLAYQPL